MSLLNVRITPAQALIAVDTDGINPAGQHYEISKLLALPHAGVVFAFRGDRRFPFDVFAHAFLAFGEATYDQIERGMVPIMGAVIHQHREAKIPAMPFQIVIAGWSAARRRVCGSIYHGDTGEDGVDHDELGARVIPWDADVPLKTPETPEDMAALAQRQVAWLRGKKTAGGGRLLIAIVTEKEVRISEHSAL